MTGKILQVIAAAAQQQSDTTAAKAPLKLIEDPIHTTEEIVHQISTDPTGFFHTLGQDAIQFGLKVLAALVIYFVGVFLIKYIKRIVSGIFERKKTEKTIATFLMSVITIVCYGLLILTTIGTLGINTTSLAALLAAGGMAIGMALSGTVQNFAGGVMLLIFKPFKVGDFIEAQGFAGTVHAVTIVNTKLKTPDNRLIIIPNGALANGNIDNYSTQAIRRVEWIVSVEYGSDADTCIALIKEILSKDKRILSSAHGKGAADIFVALKSMNENDISFVARAWVKVNDYWDVFFEHNKDFYTELPKHGFSFAYPHMDVTIKK